MARITMSKAFASKVQSFKYVLYGAMIALCLTILGGYRIGGYRSYSRISSYFSREGMESGNESFKTEPKSKSDENIGKIADTVTEISEKMDKIIERGEDDDEDEDEDEETG